MNLQQFPRLGGLILGLIGAVLAKFTIYDVFQDAQAQSANVSINMKGVVLSIVIIELGLMMVLLGPAYHGLIQHRDTKKLTPLGWVTVLVMLATGLGGYFGMQSRLTAMGYQF